MTVDMTNVRLSTHIGLLTELMINTMLKKSISVSCHSFQEEARESAVGLSLQRKSLSHPAMLPEMNL
jgi:hypothetical protein